MLEGDVNKKRREEIQASAGNILKGALRVGAAIVGGSEGGKEMDKLLGSFIKKYINTFNDNELKCLLDLLNLNDANLYKFNQGKDMFINIEKNKVSDLFKEFIYKNK